MKKPIAKYKSGSIECSVWENAIDTPTGKAVVLKATVERRYRQVNGNWASTNSYGKTDLPQVIFCLQRAYAEIIDRDNTKAAQNRAPVQQEA